MTMLRFKKGALYTGASLLGLLTVAWGGNAAVAFFGEPVHMRIAEGFALGAVVCGVGTRYLWGLAQSFGKPPVDDSAEYYERVARGISERMLSEGAAPEFHPEKAPSERAPVADERP